MVAYAVDENNSAGDSISIVDSVGELELNSNQKNIYDLIVKECDSFIDSSVDLSTNAFAIITLETSSTESDISAAVSVVKSNGYTVLNSYALYSSANNNTYDKVVLFTKEEYRTAAGRSELKNQLAITSQPQDVTGAMGTTQTVSVKATGTGLKYQWQFSTDAGKTWKNSNSTGSTTDTLKVTLYSGWNGAQLRCVITDASGKKVVSNAVTVTVINSKSDSLNITDANIDIIAN